jgi:uncharacterized protein (TIGR01777 family)
MKALVTGATGLIGRVLLERLGGAHVLTRSPSSLATELGSSARVWAWQPDLEPAPTEALEGVDVVFHLAGEPVAEGRWTIAKKSRIRSSRVTGTEHLVSRFAALTPAPRVLVCASAIGFYGDRGDAELDESAPSGDGFLAEVCRDWEAAALVAERYGTRVVLARFGIVLASQGGALARMLPPFRLGLGGKLGSGRQWMSWIHALDAVRLLLHAAERHEVRGPLNVVSPVPVTNAEFTRELGRAVSRPAFLGVPRAALGLAFGELSGALLASQRVLPRVALESRFEFQYPELGRALESCVRGVGPEQPA